MFNFLKSREKRKLDYYVKVWNYVTTHQDYDNCAWKMKIEFGIPEENAKTLILYWALGYRVKFEKLLDELNP